VGNQENWRGKPWDFRLKNNHASQLKAANMKKKWGEIVESHGGKGERAVKKRGDDTILMEDHFAEKFQKRGVLSNR